MSDTILGHFAGFVDGFVGSETIVVSGEPGEEFLNEFNGFSFADLVNN